MNTDERDDIFYEYLTDKDGNTVKRLKEKSPLIIDTESGFSIYDSSHGHCALCGRIDCHGQCFK